MKACTEKSSEKYFSGSSCQNTWGEPFWDEEKKGNYTGDISILRKLIWNYSDKTSFKKTHFLKTIQFKAPVIWTAQKTSFFKRGLLDLVYKAIL